MCLLSALLVAAGLPACATTATNAATDDWYEVRTERFEILTNGDPERAEALAVDLERFHSVLAITTTAENRDVAPPLRIFLTDDRRSFHALSGMGRRFAGVFKSRPRGNYAIVQLAQGGSHDQTSRNILFHEYVHYMQAVAGASLPSWFQEGQAEYLSTTQFDSDGSFTLGDPPLYRVRHRDYIDRIPLERLLAADVISGVAGDREDSYLQAWAMVHFFMHSPRRDHLNKYLELNGKGVSWDAAVRQAFGVEVQQLVSEMRHYANKRSFAYTKIEPAQSLYQGHPEVRPLSTPEAYQRVGDLMLATVGPEEAVGELLLDAARRDPRDPEILASLVRFYILRARHLLAKPEGSDAQADDLSSSVNSGPGSDRNAQEAAATALDKANMYLALADDLASHNPLLSSLEGDLRALEAEWASSDGLRSKSIKAARNAYRSAIKADDTLAEAYVGLGVTYLQQDNGSAEADVTLEAAAYLLPMNLHVPEALARIRLARGNFDGALNPLRYLLRRTKNSETRDWANASLNRAQDGLARKTAQP